MEFFFSKMRLPVIKPKVYGYYWKCWYTLLYTDKKHILQDISNKVTQETPPPSQIKPVVVLISLHLYEYDNSYSESHLCASTVYCLLRSIEHTHYPNAIEFMDEKITLQDLYQHTRNVYELFTFVHNIVYIVYPP